MQLKAREEFRNLVGWVGNRLKACTNFLNTMKYFEVKRKSAWVNPVKLLVTNFNSHTAAHEQMFWIFFFRNSGKPLSPCKTSFWPLKSLRLERHPPTPHTITVNGGDSRDPREPLILVSYALWGSPHNRGVPAVGSPLAVFYF